MLAAETKEKCWEGTEALLQLLMEAGHRVLKKEAQICKEEVRYLGFVLKQVPDPSWVLYTDGISLIKQGQGLSG